MSRSLTLTSLPLIVVLALAASSATALGAKSPSVRLKTVLEGYSRPILVTHAGGSSRTIFIVEQTGKVKRATYRDGAWRKLGTFLDLTGKVNDPTQPGRPEQGLLGLAFHPDYAKNGRFYVNYTRQASGEGDGDTVIAEYRRASARRADPSSERRVMVIDQPSGFHNGGHMAFGPDRKLYIGVGDGGGQGDPFENGQDLTTLNGSVLRIDPRDPDGKGPKRYAIPRGNPYVGKPGRDAIWASGLRNPWRYSFDRTTGDLWIGDVGQHKREEVNKARANAAGKGAGRGHNYGWNDCEGTLAFATAKGDGDDPCSRHVRPIHDYAHGEGWCAVIGGYVYRGPTATRWHGRYIAADWCGGLFVLGPKGKRLLTRVAARRLTSFGEDAAGRLFATSGNTILRVRLVGPAP